MIGWNQFEAYGGNREGKINLKKSGENYGKFSQKFIFDAEISEKNTFLTKKLHFFTTVWIVLTGLRVLTAKFQRQVPFMYLF